MACSLATSLEGLHPSSSGDAGGDQETSKDTSTVEGSVDSSTIDAADAFVPPSSATAIAAGGQLLQATTGAHACAIVGIDRSLFCWGANDHGQLGNGQTGTGTQSADQQTPVKILLDASNQPFTSVDEVSLGSWNTCARKGPQMYCWGQRVGGGVGDGKLTTDQTSPLDTTGFAPGGIGVGGAHACYITAGGSVFCFGLNHSEQTGHTLNTQGDQGCSPFFDMGGSYCNPSPVATVYNAKTASVSGGSLHTCALAATGGPTGGVQCWGYNGDGATGLVSVFPSQPQPTTVMKTGNTPLMLSKLRSTARHNCGIDGANGVWCWGQNDAGQSGQKPGNGFAVATQVPSLAATDVAVGEHASCAITTTKGVACWGDDTYGQLGDGMKQATATPQVVKGPGGAGALSNVTGIALGYGFACALTGDKSVYCWGHNDRGQLGDGTTQDHPFPTRVLLP